MRVKIFLFVAVLLASMWGLDRLYTFALLHNQNLKLTSVAAHPRNAELLIHGPCEPLWMVSPQLIDPHTGVSSYNLALSHSDFADNYLHLYLYLKQNRAPEYLFLFVTPESFDRRFNTFNSFRFAPYLHDSVVRKVVRENDPKYVRWSVLPFMRYAWYGKRVTFPALQGLKHYFTGRSTPYYPDGFEPPARRVWGNHQDMFARLYEGDVKFSRDPLREKYFRAIVRLAKQNGIRVLLYESPVLEVSMVHQLNRDEMIRYIRSLAAAENVDFVQFSGLGMAQVRDYFNSPLTMTMEGVRIFNDTLGSFLRATCFPEHR